MTWKILLVEDHGPLRAIVRDWLSRYMPAAEFYEASSREEAIALVQKHTLDLILMDVGLPDGNGIEVAREILAFRSEVKVIILTIQDADPLRQAAMDVGASGYVLKHEVHTQLIPNLRELGFLSEGSGAERDEKVASAISNTVWGEQQGFGNIYQSIFHGVQDAILVETPEGIILDANDAACRLYGYRREDLLLKNVRAIVPDESFLILPLQGNDGIPDVPMETINMRSDGTVFPVELTMRAHEHDGQNVVMVVVRDISERKVAESQLTLLSTALSAANNAILITDTRGVVIWVNPAFTRLTGYSLEEILGRTPRVLKSGRHPREFYTEIWSTILSGNVWEGEVVNRHKDGGEFVARQVITPVRDAVGEVTHFIAVMTDITQDRQTKEAVALKNAQLEMVHALDQAMLLHEPPEDIVDLALRHLKNMVPFTSVGMEIRDVSTGELRPLETGHGRPLLPGEAMRAVLTALVPSSGGEDAEQELLVIDVPPVLKEVPQLAVFLDDGIESYLRAPMVSGKQLIGFLHFGAGKAGAFKEAHLQSVRIAANQLSILFEQSDLRRAQKMQLIESTALHAIADAANRASDVDGLLEEIIRIIAERFYTDHFGILLWNEEQQSLWVHPSYWGIEDAYRGIMLPLGQGVVSQVFQSGEARMIADVLEEPDYLKITPQTRSELCVPLKGQRSIFGVINAESSIPAAFDQDDLAFLTTIANQAAIGIEKVYLLEQMRRHLDELQILTDISQTLRSVEDLNDMVPILLENAVQSVDANSGSVFLIDRDTREAVVQCRVPPAPDIEGSRQPLLAGVTGEVLRTGEIRKVSGIAHESLQSFTQNERVLFEGVVTSVSLPLRSSEGEIIGVMHIGRSDLHHFDDREIRLLIAIAEIGGHAFQLADSYERNLQKLRHIRALREIDLAIIAPLSMREQLNVVLENVIKELGIDAARFLMVDPRSRDLTVVCSRGFLSEMEEHPPDRRVIQQVIEPAVQGGVIHFTDAAEHLSMYLPPTFMETEGFRSYSAVPLVIQDQVQGYLEVYHRRRFTPDEDWLDFFVMLAGQAAIVVEKSRLYEDLLRSNQQLEQAYDATIEGWSRAMDLRDEETEGHTQRVTDVTLRLAKRLNVSEKELVYYRWGALLHDMGKMGVPDNILSKPGDLTEAERAIMQTHPELALKMLEPIEYLRPALDIPYCHHEKWDGTGYPQGLKGEEIPFAARIFAVVDVWDALRSDRPYRKAWPNEKVLQYLRDQAGRHFDPAIVQAFLEMLEENGGELV